MKKILLIFVLVIPICLSAQITDTIGLPLITNYSSTVYRGHAQTWDAAKDKNGILYFANNLGLLIYDGSNWEIMDIENNKMLRGVAVSDNNEVFLCGNELFGYLSVDSIGNLEYISLLDKIPEQYKENNSFTYLKIKGNVVYCYTDKCLLIYKDDKIEVIEIGNGYKKYLVSENNTIYTFNSYKIKLFKDKRVDSISIDKYVIDFIERNDTVFYVANDYSIYFIDENKRSVLYHDLKYNFNKTPIFGAKLYKNEYLLFYTYNKGVIITDFHGNLLSHIDKDAGIRSNCVFNVLIDEFDNFWFTTNKGLSYIYFGLPMRIIDKRLGFDDGSPSFIGVLGNNLYTNVGNQLYKISTKKDKNTKFLKINGFTKQMWSSLRVDENLYISQNIGFLRVDKNDNVKQYGPPDVIWNISKIPNTKSDYIMGGSTIYHYKKNKDSLVYVKTLDEITDYARALFFEDKNTMWVGGSNDGVYKVTLSDSITVENIKQYSKEQGLYNTNSIKFFQWNKKILLSTYGTLFEYDAKTDSIRVFEPIVNKFDLSSKQILQLLFIENDNFWIEYHNKIGDIEVFCLQYDKATNKFKRINSFSQMMFNFSIVDIKNYKEKIIAASQRGYVIVDSKSDYSFQKPYKVLIKSIRTITKDSLLFGGHFLNEYGGIENEIPENYEFILDYENNNLRIEYVAPEYFMSDQLKYRVKLLNFDKDWSNWNDKNSVSYNNLSPGKYTFLVESKNIFGNYSQITSLKIRIKPPWYMTIAAYIFYFFIGIGLMFIIIKFFTNRLRRKNEKLEGIVKNRTKEISSKNAELQQQKEELLSKSQNLELANQELEKLSVIAQETDNAVMLTDAKGNYIWTNQSFSKILGYSLEELKESLSRSKLNILHTVSEEDSISIVKKCFNEKISVEYNHKLSDKSGNTIWLRSTLTPILDEDGNIKSIVEIDSDITQLKKIEIQLIQQRDTVTSSIKYAKNIQTSILPKIEQINKFFDSFIIYRPKDIVSGDFYWLSNLFNVEDNELVSTLNNQAEIKVGQTIFFSVVDCTGHGVPGAFMSLIGSRLLSEIVNEKKNNSPMEIMNLLDEKLIHVLKRNQRDNHDGMAVSLCRIDKILENNEEKIRLTYSGAKQNITIYSHKTKTFKRLKGAIRQVGFVLNKKLTFSEQTLILDINDYIFMYSDGLQDLNNPERGKFSYSRVISELSKSISMQPKVIGSILYSTINNWLGGCPQRDDITFIGLKIK